MKRSFSYRSGSLRSVSLIVAATGLIAATYGLVRLAYGLMLPDVQRSLDFASTTAGTISAGGSVAYCIAAVSGMVLVARHARLLVVLAACTAGVGAIGMACSSSVMTFAVACVVASAGAGAASPALVAVVARNVAAECVGRGQAVVNAGTGSGLVLAGLGALLLLPDWRTAWAVSGVVTLVVCAAVLLLDRGVPAVPQDERGPSETVPPLGWWRSHERVILAAFLAGAASAAMWNSGRALLGAAGLEQGQSVAAWVAIGLGGVAVTGTARVLDGLAPRTAWSLTAATLGLATAALVVAPTALPLVIVACACFGWGYTAATGALIAWTTAIDSERAASGAAMLFVVLVAGQALGASVAGGVIASAGYVPAFLGAAVVAGAAAVAAVLPRPQRRQLTAR